MKIKLLLPILFLFLFSCKKDKAPDLQPVQLELRLSYASEEFGPKLGYTDVLISVTNLSTKVSNTYTPNGESVILSDLTPGEYDIDATITVERDKYNEVTGADSNTDVTFNASAKKISLTSSTTLNLELVSGLLGDFVIKQIYYAGSDQKEGALFRDQFFEIYNNTDRILYADSLYFGRLWGNQSAVKDTKYYQSNGQYDWSKSPNMTIGDAANTDYVYLRDLFMIPGDGTMYPIQPGKSIVIAQNAMNHKVPFTGNNGKEVAIKNPDLTVDLSKANFEVYYGDIPGRTPFATDIDNPDVPNVEVVDFEGNDWILDNLGRDSYVIFKRSSRQDISDLKRYIEPLKGTPSPNQKEYRQLPISWIMDAVEVQPQVNASRVAKKLGASLDAGLTFVTSGAYSSQSVIRKTDKTVNGIRRLKDTNNSTEDFMVIKADPFGFGD